MTEQDMEAAERAVSGYADPIIKLPFRSALVGQVAAAIAKAREQEREALQRLVSPLASSNLRAIAYHLEHKGCAEITPEAQALFLRSVADSLDAICARNEQERAACEHLWDDYDRQVGPKCSKCGVPMPMSLRRAGDYGRRVNQAGGFDAEDAGEGEENGHD